MFGIRVRVVICTIEEIVEFAMGGGGWLVGWLLMSLWKEIERKEKDETSVSSELIQYSVGLIHLVAVWGFYKGTLFGICGSLIGRVIDGLSCCSNN